jgi:hypothetical protein
MASPDIFTKAEMGGMGKPRLEADTVVQLHEAPEDAGREFDRVEYSARRASRRCAMI